MNEKSGFHKKDSQEQVDNTTLPTMDSPEEAIPRNIVPWPRDDDKSRYLGLRASGFGIREALNFLGKAKSTLSMWRQNEVFVNLENNVPELRKTLAIEYAGLEFLRNYRLVLEKDFRVLKSSLNRKTIYDDDGVPHQASQDQQDNQYLLRLRQHYTPQQLQAIEQLFGRGDSQGESLNWTDLVLTLSRKTEELKIETRQRQDSELSKLEE